MGMHIKRWSSEEIEWLASNYKRLGAEECARCIGRTVMSIYQKAWRIARNRNSVRETAKSIDWGEWDEHLGTMTDQALADIIGLRAYVVSLRRRSLGISSFNKKSVRIEWEKYDDLLGKISDVALAKKIGCTTGAVRNRREQKNISPSRSKYVTTKSGRRRIYKISPRDNDDVQRYFGIAPDKLIGDIFGLSSAMICIRRTELGIPSYEQARPEPPMKMPWHAKEVEIVKIFPHLVACRLLPWRTREAVRSKRRETDCRETDLVDWATKMARQELERRRRKECLNPTSSPWPNGLHSTACR